MSDFDIEKFRAESTCDVCGRQGISGVGSSALGPISLAYCGECIQNGAEPEWLLGMTWDSCGQGEHVADWVKDTWTWIDDKYVSWEEFDALARANPEKWAFDEEAYAASCTEVIDGEVDFIDMDFGELTV